MTTSRSSRPSNQIGFSIPRNFVLTYQDGSKTYLDRAERDDLVLAGLVRQVGPRDFKFIGQAKTYHSFADFAREYVPAKERQLRRRFLPGSFVFEHAGKRHRELMETPDAAALRLCSA